MPAAASRRFLFDVSFDGPPPPEPARRGETLAAPSAPLATEEALATARAAAFEEGRTAGIAEATSAREALLATALQQMAASASDLLAGRQETVRRIEAEAVELTLSVTRKVLPTVAKKAALDEISGLVRQCLAEAFDEPRLVVRLPDALFDAAKPLLDGVAAASGFMGKLVILADEALGPEDARVEWADGGAERDMARLWNDIDAAALRTADLMTRGAEK
jgi:flagellar assembly protein FliH